MSDFAPQKIEDLNQKRKKVQTMQFDDMESFEHTKLKPLSITLAVEEKSRHILGFRLSEMPAKGLIAAKSVRKYGKRKDYRKLERRRLFEQISSYVEQTCTIKSDENPLYKPDVVILHHNLNLKSVQNVPI